ncbi:MAG: glycosyltransferase family 2 protein [Flavobacteriaceae bacterium]|nr:glycosyltransferase family 2 protein [Flavobacteriaceae bacterium]
MISVVIPLYNKEAFIAETINSVLSQTYTEFEIIVVNDGSTDASLSALNTITDPRIKIISIENSGVSVARNAGVDMTLGDWIAFLDGDDWWAPTFLEEAVKAITDYPEHKLFASGRSRVFKEEVDRYEHQFLPKDGTTSPVNYFKVISLFLPIINASNAVIHKSLFETAGYFRPGQRKHEDHDLWMRLAVNQEVVFFNKNLSFYRKTEDNTASLASFSATDFHAFLSTMVSVKGKIKSQEQIYFSKYYNKYAVLVYLQYYGQYTKKENALVFNQIEKLLTGSALLKAKLIKLLPLKWFYPWYKKGKG